MKKLLIIFPLLSLSLIGCSSISKGSEQVSHSYEISQTSLSLKVGEESKLYVSDNGTIISNVTWSSDSVQVASVTSDGKVVAIKEGVANIFATIDKTNKLTCKVTVSAKDSGGGSSSGGTNDTEIVKFFKNNSDYILEDGTSYAFVSAKSRYDNYSSQYLIWNLYFIYDTSDDTCMIKSNLSGTTSGNLKYNYYGYNVFNWGDYKNGLFCGGYSQETSAGSDTYAKLEVTFDNSTLVFKTNKELAMSYDLTYTVTANEFTSNVTADDALTILLRVEECCSYAKEMFETFKVDLSLF